MLQRGPEVHAISHHEKLANLPSQVPKRKWEVRHGCASQNIQAFHRKTQTKMLNWREAGNMGVKGDLVKFFLVLQSLFSFAYELLRDFHRNH